MTIAIADRLVPKNGLNYPLLDSKDLRGGAITFRNMSEFRATPSTHFVAGMLISLPGAWYMLDNDLETLLLVGYISNGVFQLNNGSNGGGSPMRYVGHFVPERDYLRNDIVTDAGTDGSLHLFVLTAETYNSVNHPLISSRWIDWGPANAINTEYDWTAINNEILAATAAVVALAVS